MNIHSEEKTFLESNQHIQDKIYDLQKQTQIIPIFQLIRQIWPLGFISYGGPLAHIGLFRDKFVQKLKWIDQDRFVELTTICQSIPGPTSTQLLISIAIYMNRSLSGGFVAFLLFFFPTFLVLYLAGTYLKELKIEGMILQLFNGFKCAAVAVVFQAFWGLSKKYRQESDSILLFCFCGFTYLIFQNSKLKLIIVTSMFAMFIFAVIYSFFFKKIQINNKNTKQKKIIESWILGKNSIFIFFALLIISGILHSIFYENIYIAQFAIFYRIGAIIIGGGHVILPMMYTQFSGYNYFTEQLYWNGFSIVSCLPGPMFNLSAYIGALINGLFGAILCSIALFLPSFLTIWAILPYWQQYRKSEKIQKIIYGLCCASIGFILASVFQLWIISCKNSVSNMTTFLNSLITFLSYYLLQTKKIQIPYVIFIGGLLFLIKEQIKL